MKKQHDNSAMVRAAKAVKLLLEAPDGVTLKELAEDLQIGLEATRGIIQALRSAGWNVTNDGYPDYLYRIEK